jgi:NAD(P)-dependent dehydrogenase (short-subunit alcohol dehydrogenase family)
MMVALSFSTAPVASVKGTAAFGVYAASKAAIRSFVRTWTTDLKDRRIRSNVVSPGPINTPLTSRQSADVIARIVSTISIARMGAPEEVAKVAPFLASEDSSFVRGIELFVGNHLRQDNEGMFLRTLTLEYSSIKSNLISTFGRGYVAVVAASG